MANTFTPSQLVSMVAGSYAYHNSIFFRAAFSDVPEFNLAASGSFKYAPGDTINISLPYYLKAQQGLTRTDDDIIEDTIAYLLTAQDIYGTQYAVDNLSTITDVVGGQSVLTENPFKIIGGESRMTDTARRYFNRYRAQQGLAILAAIDGAIAEKARTSFWYTPVDRPSKLKPVNSFADISSVTSLADDLNFSHDRTSIMNITDATIMSNDLQNSFNVPANTAITKTAWVGDKGSGLAGFDIFKSSQVRRTDVSPEFTFQQGGGTPQPFATVTSVSVDGSQITFRGVQAVGTVIFNAGTHLALFATRLLNRYLQDSIDTTLVVTVLEDALGDGAGNVTITLKEPLIAVGGQANIDILPAAADIAEIFPAVSNNYFTTGMGYVSNCIPMPELYGALNADYKSPDSKMMLNSYAQGDINNITNKYRLDTTCPTLAIPRYGINLLGSV